MPVFVLALVTGVVGVGIDGAESNELRLDAEFYFFAGLKDYEKASNVVSLSRNLVAGPGVEPGSVGYEPTGVPFSYPATVWLSC